MQLLQDIYVLKSGDIHFYCCKTRITLSSFAFKAGKQFPQGLIELISIGDVVHIVHGESKQSFLSAEYGAIRVL